MAASGLGDAPALGALGFGLPALGALGLAAGVLALAGALAAALVFQKGESHALLATCSPQGGREHKSCERHRSAHEHLDMHGDWWVALRTGPGCSVRRHAGKH